MMRPRIVDRLEAAFLVLGFTALGFLAATAIPEVPW